VVAGEAGIGTSRLVHEAADVTRAPGMTVQVGQAAPGGGATALRALAEALPGAFRGTAPPVPRMRSIPSLGSMRARDYHLPAPS
jgi:hypothetical protein